MLRRKKIGKGSCRLETTAEHVSETIMYYLTTQALMGKPRSNLHSERKPRSFHSDTELSQWTQRKKQTRLSTVFSLHLMTTTFLHNRREINGRQVCKPTFLDSLSLDRLMLSLAKSKKLSFFFFFTENPAGLEL